MENSIGQWATIPLNDLKKRELDTFIHPDDLEKVALLQQPVNLVIANSDDFLELQVGNTNSVRIKAAITQLAIKPDYFINDRVKTVNSKGSVETGLVKDFYWHMNSGKYVYLLEVDGKIKSRRYSAEDLESTVNN